MGYIHCIFIHPSIDGYGGCFHDLVIVNNAAMNVGMCISFQISVCVCVSDIYPEVTLLDHTVVLSEF